MEHLSNTSICLKQKRETCTDFRFYTLYFDETLGMGIESPSSSSTSLVRFCSRISCSIRLYPCKMNAVNTKELTSKSRKWYFKIVFLPHLQEINTSLGSKAHLLVVIFCYIYNSNPAYMYVHVIPYWDPLKYISCGYQPLNPC